MDVCANCLHKEVCKYSTSFPQYADYMAKHQKEVLKSGFSMLNGLEFTMKIDCDHYCSKSTPFAKTLRDR